MSDDNHPRRPIAEIRIGSCKAAIWENAGDGRTFHSASFTRLYKTDDGWRSTSSFGMNDLPHLAMLADRAQARLAELATDDRE